ncbi:MAG TPA: FAD-dependent oxidoreductase [Flavipsychrobacter sp.]|nr:FAD-dependent oxidoreductase [Flavipsychrobacter sp.]
MLSYWEQQSFIHYDHIVIGSGIVGLNVAIEIKKQYPDSSVLVLERSLLPTGASTRNAGFACMGSVTELLDDLKTMSENEVVQLFEWRKKGLERLRKKLGDDRIEYRQNGSYELISDKEIDALEKLDYLNNLLFPAIHQPSYKLSNEKISKFGLSSEYVKALIENTSEGELHSGKLLRALIDFALQCGIEIKTGADVLSFEEEENYVLVQVKDPFRDEILILHCNTTSICTNAFTKKLLPDVDVKPGRGQVLITQPIPDLKFKGIFHFDKGYYYFREIDGRVLLGGGRNLDMEGETTTDFSLNELIQEDLEQKLHDIILPDTHFQIEQRWTGIMAFGPNKYPIVRSFSDRVFGAFRMGGMGVALASEVAVQLADMIKDKID